MTRLLSLVTTANDAAASSSVITASAGMTASIRQALWTAASIQDSQAAVQDRRAISQGRQAWPKLLKGGDSARSGGQPALQV